MKLEDCGAEAMKAKLETVACGFCGQDEADPWGSERGFTVVRCRQCGFLYLNERPSAESIATAIELGVQSEAGDLDIRERRVSAKVGHYRRLLFKVFKDRLQPASSPVRWLDIGAGYGEVVEAVASIVPPGSIVEGVEPMRDKALAARARGLMVENAFLNRNRAKVDIVSLIDVFSHVPNFQSFLQEVVCVLSPDGEIFIETGNLADLNARRDFPGELGLPDHVAFAGEQHIAGFLKQAGFKIVEIRRERVDTIFFFLKTLIKKIIGRNVSIRLPYTSSYRSLLIRARLHID